MPPREDFSARRDRARLRAGLRPRPPPTAARTAFRDDTSTSVKSTRRLRCGSVGQEHGAAPSSAGVISRPVAATCERSTARLRGGYSKHDPEKCAGLFRKTSCSIKKLKRFPVEWMQDGSHGLSFVIAGLDTASQVSPTCGSQ